MRLRITIDEHPDFSISMTVPNKEISPHFIADILEELVMVIRAKTVPDNDLI